MRYLGGDGLFDFGYPAKSLKVVEAQAKLLSHHWVLLRYELMKLWPFVCHFHFLPRPKN